MKRPTAALVLFFVLVTGVGRIAAEASVPESVKPRLQEVYRAAEQLLANDGGTYRKDNDDDPEIEVRRASVEPEKYSMFGSLGVQVWAESMRLAGVYNYRLAKELENAPSSSLPTLTLEAAIQRAEDYLARWKIALPNEKALGTARFDGSYRSCWEIRWTRSENGHPWDDFNPDELESVYVIFHETRGLVGIGNNIYSPSPKSFEIHIVREEAITKAEKYVPLVQRTPYYRQARKGGFVVSGVKCCDLKIVAPNWLLDPKRASWMPEKPSEETRLCWVIRFTTVDSIADKRDVRDENGKPLKLIAPDILIYLDASTGEVVGANFT